MPHNVSFVFSFVAVGVYEIKDYAVEEEEEGNAAGLLIFIWRNICEYAAVLKSGIMN